MLNAIQADITTLKVDAIVNAANETLLGGGGVDGAIHRAGVVERMSGAWRGYPTGEAKLTRGYNLPARIHTVRPVWHGGAKGEAEKLRNCYRNSLELAIKHQFKSVAFPSVSAGIYGYPVAEAAKIAVFTCREVLLAARKDLDITFCCFSSQDFTTYTNTLERY